MLTIPATQVLDDRVERAKTPPLQPALGFQGAAQRLVRAASCRLTALEAGLRGVSGAGLGGEAGHLFEEHSRVVTVTRRRDIRLDGSPVPVSVQEARPA
jgi:hypothetical protein